MVYRYHADLFYTILLTDKHGRRTGVLQGEADPVVPVASAEDIAARVPGAELRLIPGLGHDIPSELVTIFADAITAAAERATD